jgi:hypothetical protein
MQKNYGTVMFGGTQRNAVAARMLLGFLHILHVGYGFVKIHAFSYQNTPFAVLPYLSTVFRGTQ